MKWSAFVLGLVISLLGGIPMSAAAQEPSPGRGQCADGITVNERGEIVVSGCEQRPNAFYILSRSRSADRDRDPRRSFTAEIPRPLQRQPF